MNDLLSMTTLVALRMLGRLHRLSSPDGDDRGDVPGWVLVTLMSAGLVSVLWVTAEGQLKGLLEHALSSVTGP